MNRNTVGYLAVILSFSLLELLTFLLVRKGDHSWLEKLMFPLDIFAFPLSFGYGVPEGIARIFGGAVLLIIGIFIFYFARALASKS